MRDVGWAATVFCLDFVQCSTVQFLFGRPGRRILDRISFKASAGKVRYNMDSAAHILSIYK